MVTGDQIRRFFSRRDALELLQQAIPEAESYTAGGCYLAAKALVKLLGRPAKLWGVWQRNVYENAYVYGGEFIQAGTRPWFLTHVIVKLAGDQYLDADGLFTEHEMLQKMQRELPARSFPTRDPSGQPVLAQIHSEFKLGPAGRPKNCTLADTTAWPHDVAELVALLQRSFRRR